MANSDWSIGHSHEHASMSVQATTPLRPTGGSYCMERLDTLNPMMEETAQHMCHATPGSFVSMPSGDEGLP